MLTEKDNLLAMLAPDGLPERLVNQYGPFVGVMSDPVAAYAMGKFAPGDSVDAWGVHISWRPGDPGMMPKTDQANKVLPDVTRWREYVKVPDLAAHCSDPALWEPTQALIRQIHDQGNLSLVLMGTGIFERLHYLMGFEDTLENLLLEPEAMHELVDAIAENRFQHLKLLVDNLQPDAILSHDDWGSKQNLFMSPDTWREFFKEPYRRMYGYAREHGVIVVHHADSHCTAIAEDMAEIGIQIWQGVLPQNDIPKMQAELNGRMVLMGGIDAALVDLEDATEESIRAETRRAIRDYAPGGGFIPCTTQGLPRGTLDPNVYDIVTDEIFRYNHEVYGAAGMPAEQLPMGPA